MFASVGEAGLENLNREQQRAAAYPRRRGDGQDDHALRSRCLARRARRFARADRAPAWSVCGRRFARREAQRGRAADPRTVVAQRQATRVAPRGELARDRRPGVGVTGTAAAESARYLCLVDEKGCSGVHPPTRSCRPDCRIDTRALPRPARREAASQSQRDAVHASVLSGHDPLAESGDRGTPQAGDRRLGGRGFAASNR
jgi:hypothetical protein